MKIPRMPESATLDELDRRIVLALQLNGRASWKQVAQALGAPESTVTRRGQALLADRTVAVTGVLDHLRCGLGISVYMRFRSRPGRALTVARAVAGLSTPRFVTVMTGSFDVAAEVVVKSHRELTTVLAQLDCLDDVLESESMVVTRKFTAFEEWNPGTLGGPATDVLRSVGTVTDYAHREWIEPETLTDQEFAIARVLAEDGRATYTSVAALTGISESTAARRVESLVKRGCLRFRTLFDASLVGLDVEFLLWLTVAPEHVDEVGERLAKQPSTRYVSAATGRYNMVLQGVLRGYGDLYPYTTHLIGQLPGVVLADLTLQLHTLKRAWVAMGDDGRPVPKKIS